jgi:hypothetical protein
MRDTIHSGLGRKRGIYMLKAIRTRGEGVGVDRLHTDHIMYVPSRNQQNK